MPYLTDKTASSYRNTWYQVLGSTSIPARLDTLVYWESHGSPVLVPPETVIGLGWSRIGLAVFILHAMGAGLIGRPAVISGRYYKCHSLHPLRPLSATATNTHSCKTQLCGTGHGEWSWVSRHCMLVGRGRRNPVWSGKEAHWSLRGLIVKSAQHCGADYEPFDGSNTSITPDPLHYIYWCVKVIETKIQTSKLFESVHNANRYNM